MENCSQLVSDLQYRFLKFHTEGAYSTFLCYLRNSVDDSGTQHIFRSRFILCKVKSDSHDSTFWRDIICLGGDECTSVGQIAG